MLIEVVSTVGKLMENIYHLILCIALLLKASFLKPDLQRCADTAKLIFPDSWKKHTCIKSISNYINIKLWESGQLGVVSSARQ